jgi:phage gp36-like protein
MAEITMTDVTNEINKVLSDKNFVTKETAPSLLVTAACAVGAFLVTRRWIDRRIEKKVDETLIHQLKK